MAKYSEEVRQQKIGHAKELYAKGFEYETISEIMSIPVSTLKKWGRENSFDDYKQGYAISIRELRGAILESFNQKKKGETPKLSADDAAKYSKAFISLSDNRKTISYTIYAFEMLTEAVYEDIANSDPKKRKEIHKSLQYLRGKSQAIVDKLIADVIENDKG